MSSIIHNQRWRERRDSYRPAGEVIDTRRYEVAAIGRYWPSRTAPEGIVEPFVLTCSPPGGMVLDPFCGSATTLAVSERLGRRWIGIDCRQSQVELSQRRIDEVRSARREAV